MELAIDITSPVYPYVQIADQLRQAIADGETVAGIDLGTGAFPSYWALVRELGCAYNTVRRAVDVLKREGLVVTIPGRGTFIRRDA